MAFRSIAFPWLSGGLIVLGYAAYSWRRAMHKRLGFDAPLQASKPEASKPEASKLESLANRLEHVPDEAVLDPEPERRPANSNAASHNSNAASHGADLGALFLGRASVALSPFHAFPDWPSGSR